MSLTTQHVNAARRPRSSVQGTIGVVAVADSSGEGARAMLAGLNAVVAPRNWMLHLLTSADYLADVFAELKPELLVLIGNPPVSTRRWQRRAVVVSAGMDLSAAGVPSVDIDDAAVGRLAAQHFLERGLRSHGAFGFWHLAWARARIDAFRRAILEAGHPCSVAGWPLDSDPAVGKHAFGAPDVVKAWLREVPKPIGILAGCDAWGRQLSNFCRLAGLRVPEDVALLGVDNDAGLCELASPPLSSISIPWRRVGYEAGLLGERLLGERLARASGPRERAAPTHCLRIPPLGIFVRRSSDTLAIDDADVAAALTIIHEHADRPISVAQILRRVPVTQHRLERQFKRLVGRRMTQEIRRVHVERARRLISTTDLSMPEVARASGFTSASKLSVAFRSETGQTPGNYRRRTHIAAT